MRVPASSGSDALEDQNPVKHARKLFSGFDVERNGFLDVHHLKATCAALAKHEAREVKISAHQSTFVVCLFLSASAFKDYVARNTSLSVTSAILRFQKQWHETARYNALSDLNDRYRSPLACPFGRLPFFFCGIWAVAGTHKGSLAHCIAPRTRSGCRESCGERSRPRAPSCVRGAARQGRRGRRLCLRTLNACTDQAI